MNYQIDCRTIIYLSYRYSYIVHPLAYRASTNSLPDNCAVDAIQWCILNLVEEPHYNNPQMWKGPVHGIELFNDFTYSLSYNSELSATVIDDPNFVIPCYNGENFHIIFNKSTLLQYLSKE